jgi:hypothetical protein
LAELSSWNEDFLKIELGFQLVFQILLLLCESVL